jgi:hypothetical protein
MKNKERDGKNSQNCVSCTISYLHESKKIDKIELVVGCEAAGNTREGKWYRCDRL